MSLTYAEFKKALASDMENIRQGKAPKGGMSCADCGTPLMESVTGNRRLGSGKHVCSDCYFERWDSEIDDHPILPPRLARGG